MRNGNFESDEERTWQLLQGANSVEDVVPVLGRAAQALLAAGNALRAIAGRIGAIESDTARALSDTTVLKKYLADITEREQALRRQVANITVREQEFRQEVNNSLMAKARAPVAKQRPKAKTVKRRPKRRR